MVCSACSSHRLFANIDPIKHDLRIAYATSAAVLHGPVHVRTPSLSNQAGLDTLSSPMHSLLRSNCPESLPTARLTSPELQTPLTENSDHIFVDSRMMTLKLSAIFVF